eukprot:326366-Chlamydomonas_euryale.AAC.2
MARPPSDSCRWKSRRSHRNDGDSSDAASLPPPGDGSRGAHLGPECKWKGVLKGTVKREKNKQRKARKFTCCRWAAAPCRLQQPARIYERMARVTFMVLPETA